MGAGAPVNRNITWDTAVTEAEAKKATTGSGNTAPGADGISVALLQLAWPAVGSYITDLFRGCLAAGYHPLPSGARKSPSSPNQANPKKPIPPTRGTGPSLFSPVLERDSRDCWPEEFHSWRWNTRYSRSNTSEPSPRDRRQTWWPASSTTPRWPSPRGWSPPS